MHFDDRLLESQQLGPFTNPPVMNGTCSGCPWHAYWIDPGEGTKYVVISKHSQSIPWLIALGYVEARVLLLVLTRCIRDMGEFCLHWHWGHC